MTKVTKKTLLGTVDGTPKKRVFLSIISDYDLKTGVCELIDNALDFWITNGANSDLLVSVSLDHERQIIRVEDNAGGVEESDVELLVSPGASRNDTGESLIGIFGVGSKRAGVALGELVEIRTRHATGKSIAIDLTNEWVESPNWDLDFYEVPDISPGTTIVVITKVRQPFDQRDVEFVRRHLAETYGWFIGQGCAIQFNGEVLSPVKFDAWAYPPDYRPRQAQFDIEPAPGHRLDVTLTAGLILDRNPETDNYGVYFYCNNRLIMKEVKVREVGYFVSAEAGVPHPDASLCRVIVKFQGPPELMPWNSSKSAINFGDPAYSQIRHRVIDFASYFTGLSRRLKDDWHRKVFRYSSGSIQTVDSKDASSTRKKILPKLPRSRNPSYIVLLREHNKRRINDQPWLLGLVEAMGFVDILRRQKYETSNRLALILLDSNFEIALKEYIVHREDLFPPHKYTNAQLVQLFRNRTNVIKEVQAHTKFPIKLIRKVNHYYASRNALIHERATGLITDEQVEDYRETIERVLTKLFRIQFPD